MMFFEILRQMLRTLWAHKLRSFLTMFGIAWGVGSLLLLVGLGEGFRSGNRKELNSLGEDIMFVFPGRAPTVGSNMSSSHAYRLTYKDYADIQREAPHVRAVAPVLSRKDIREVSDYGNTNGEVVGIPPHFNTIRYLPLAEGRWLNDADDMQKRFVCVIGDEMVKNLFPGGRTAVGSFILLNGIRFEVIGVVQRVGHGDDNSTNNRVFLTYTMMHQFFPLTGQEENAVSFLNYRPRVREEHELAKQEVRKVIARNHGFDWRNADAFEDWDTIQNAEMVGKIFDVMDIFLGGVGLVTLTLGAIGVINIMLVAVSERTREIGLRKALGATNRSILLQFFLEGAFLTLLSGAIGMGGAAAVMKALSGMGAAAPGFDPPTMSYMSAMLAIGTLALAGIVAGLYPARKAAMLQPVDALRQE